MSAQDIVVIIGIVAGTLIPALTLATVTIINALNKHADTAAAVATNRQVTNTATLAKIHQDTNSALTAVTNALNVERANQGKDPLPNKADNR